MSLADLIDKIYLEAVRELVSLDVEAKWGVPEDYINRTQKLKKLFGELRLQAIQLQTSDETPKLDKLTAKFEITQIELFEKRLKAIVSKHAQRAKTVIAGRDEELSCGDFGNMATKNDSLQ